ncbi:unnamed protein product [Candida verbasci]|uniref:DNA replication complex GINS protein PSF1 n=1 Tax=Candida verbasci TaxID=1227364 RepID=A0A9W4TZP2_9ASCO|nr:unnamed protein product [Candida verbasci]
MYGDTANKLILDAKRTSNLSNISLYQADLIKEIVKEINDLNKDVEFLQEQEELNQDEDNKVNQCQLFVTHLSMRRNKRCLIAYEKLRSDKIAEFIWSNQDNLNQDNLSYHEQEFVKDYNQSITAYKSHFSDLDLSGDLEPPTNIFIDVRVLKEGGEVTTEYGSFNLIKNSQFFVRKSDVERLIQQGYLEQLSS